MPLTIERLKYLLRYNPKTGVFTRLRRMKTFPAGTKAGRVSAQGYIVIDIDGEKYPAQNLAWFYTYGVWPNIELDHKDRDRENTKIKNLREVTRSQNNVNGSAMRTSKTGFRGVFPQGRRFRVQIEKGDRRYSLGYFDTAEEGYAVYCAAVKTLHGIERTP